jgi:hypothetical protein
MPRHRAPMCRGVSSWGRVNRSVGFNGGRSWSTGSLPRVETLGRKFLAAAGCITLVAITVVAFVVFDRDSHSASDTLRPFLVTMIPVWLVAFGVGRYLSRGGRSPR